MPYGPANCSFKRGYFLEMKLNNNKPQNEKNIRFFVPEYDDAMVSRCRYGGFMFCKNKQKPTAKMRNNFEILITANNFI
jgi:hypothetical protein